MSNLSIISESDYEALKAKSHPDEPGHDAPQATAKAAPPRAVDHKERLVQTMQALAAAQMQLAQQAALIDGLKAELQRYTGGARGHPEYVGTPWSSYQQNAANRWKTVLKRRARDREQERQRAEYALLPVLQALVDQLSAAA